MRIYLIIIASEIAVETGLTPWISISQCPTTLAGTVVLLTSYLAARPATGIDPMDALRAE